MQRFNTLNFTQSLHLDFPPALRMESARNKGSLRVLDWWPVRRLSF